MLNQLAALLIFAGIAIIFWYSFKKSTKETLYRFRNIGYLAGLIAVFVVAITAAIHDVLLNRYENPITWLSEVPELFANVTVFAFIILAILMGVSNLSLMKHEGRKLKNVFGTLLECSFVMGTILIYAVVKIFEHTGFGLSGNSMEVFLSRFIPRFLFLVLDYAECVMLAMIIMGWIAARQKPAYDKDFIIIPGCSIAKDGGLYPLIKGRVNGALKYAWDQEIASGKPLKFVPSGGKGSDEVMSEGSAMAMYLLCHSVEDYEILPEKQSANTYENFKFSKSIIDNVMPDAKIAFSTTNYHMLRCGLLAAKVGIDAEGIASKTKWYFWPNGFAREVVAIFKMTAPYHIAVCGFLAGAAAVLTALS